MFLGDDIAKKAHKHDNVAGTTIWNCIYSFTNALQLNRVLFVYANKTTYAHFPFEIDISIYIYCR